MFVNNPGVSRYRNAFLTESEHIVMVARAGGGKGARMSKYSLPHCGTNLNHLAQVLKVD